MKRSCRRRGHYLYILSPMSQGRLHPQRHPQTELSHLSSLRRGRIIAERLNRITGPIELCYVIPAANRIHGYGVSSGSGLLWFPVSPTFGSFPSPRLNRQSSPESAAGCLILKNQGYTHNKTAAAMAARATTIMTTLTCALLFLRLPCLRVLSGVRGGSGLGIRCLPALLVLPKSLSRKYLPAAPILQSSP